MSKGCDGENGKWRKNQPSNSGGTCIPPEMHHCLQKPKWLPSGPKMTDRAWKGVYCGLQNIVLDKSTPSMRNIELPVKSKMAAKGPQNGKQGLKRRLTLDYWVLQTTFAK